MGRSAKELQRSHALACLVLCIGWAFGSAGCFNRYSRERSVQGFRSPSYDYQQQPRIAGGDVLGADGKSVSDKLAEGPTQNTLAPGWRLRRKDGLTYDPKQRVGGTIDPPHEEESTAPNSPP